MPAVQPTRNLMSLRGLLASWLAAAFAYPAALLLAACGQGIGAVLAGCRWIGLSIPPHREVWALVNEPSPGFASQQAATPYWLGSVALPLVVAFTAIALLPRPRRITSELVTAQLAMAAAAVGGAWLPLVEPSESHLARWLAFRRWPDELVLLAPLLAVAAVVLPTLRVLALARIHHREMPRLLRVATVLLHLVLPAATFVAVATALLGRVPVSAAVAVLFAVAVAPIVAFIGYPPALVRPVEGVGGRQLAWWLVAALAAVSMVGLAGRPLPSDRVSGVLWGRPAAYDNIRRWIEPLGSTDGSVAADPGVAVR